MMATISIRKELAIDLIKTKIELLNSKINKILQKWGQQTAEEMITKTREGLLEEAEGDAIVLTNLLEKLKELENLLKQAGGL